MLDSTVLFTIVSIVGSVAVFAVLGVRITRLMKTCDSSKL